MSGGRRIALDVKWRIENIQSWLQKRDDALYSPQFLAETLTNTRWRLCLSPNWQFTEKYVSLTLQRDIEHNGPKLIDISCELSFLTCDGSSPKSKFFAKKFSLKGVSDELNVKQAEILSEKNEVYLLEAVLTVCCKIWKNSSIVSKGQCSILRSVIGTKVMDLNATVENFGLSSHAVVNILTPSTDIRMISLDVFLKESDKNYQVYEFLFKSKHVERKMFCSYSFKLYVRGVGGRKQIFREIFKDFIESVNSSYVHKDEMNKYLPNNTLTLQLQVSYHPGIVTESSKNEFNNYVNLPCRTTDLEDLEASDSERVLSSTSEGCPSTDPCFEEEQSMVEEKCLSLTTLKEDMASLYKDRLFCDTKLQTNTETFPAHRNVLSARSPVFKKMFMSDMKEKAGECINISDISSDTVSRMLKFLYTDCAGNLEMQSAEELYIASDKYDIASLKQICASFMKKNLCPSNVCKILVLADTHQDKDLESAAQDYVLTNDEEVFYSDEWKMFMRNYSALAAQVMYLKFTNK